MNRPVRRLVPLLALIAALVVALPAMSADPPSGASPAPSPGKSTAPGQQKARPAKAPEIRVTLRGTIRRVVDEKGRPTFTLTRDGTLWELSAGPKWWWGADGGPLARYVNRTVVVVGTHREGSTDVSVETVDGTALRAPGKPPWAGGPKVVGERHPGWKAWKLAGRPGLGLGRATAPGQLKRLGEGGTTAG